MTLVLGYTNNDQLGHDAATIKTAKKWL